MTPTEVTEILRHLDGWPVQHCSSKKVQAAIDAAVEMIERLEEAESDALEQARLNGMGSEREAELLAKLEAAEKERNDFAQRLVQSEQGWRKAVVERDVLRDRRALESQESGALHEAVERACEERDELRVKIEQMEKQEPFDANCFEFRRAFDAALRTGNWPTKKLTFGYRSPMTQMAWQVAFCTVNNLKLYALPGAKGDEK